jgi:hypothetical protein
MFQHVKITKQTPKKSRNCRGGLLGMQEQWRHVSSTHNRHWRHVGSRTIVKYTLKY